jgi:hypothetical protein
MVPAQKHTNSPTQSTLDGVVGFDFLCDNGRPDGRDVQVGSTDGMVQQRHVGGFLVFPVCGVWFNLQDLRFIPAYFMAFYVSYVGLIWIFQTDHVSGYICAPSCILLKVCLFHRCNICHIHMGCCTHTVKITVRDNH